MHGTGSWSRRDLLRAALVVPFALTTAGEFAGASAQQPSSGPARPTDPKDVDSFLAIHRDGRVTIYTSKVDVGTGMRIAMAQMAAEELGVGVDRITVIDGDTGLCPNTGGTGGSTGLTRGGTAVRQAAATARQALLSLGVSHFNRQASDLDIVNGAVRIAAATATEGASAKSIDIGDLLAGRPFAIPVDAKAPLRPPRAYSVVGTSPARPDVPAKCTGRYVFIQDFAVPGMLHARVIRPPAIGARLLDVDEASIRAIPDIRIVRVESFLAVVARDEWAAVRAAAGL
jgi:nicotinate dehydrogenase subunit B